MWGMQSDRVRVLSLCARPGQSLRLDAPLELVIVVGGEGALSGANASRLEVASGDAIVVSLADPSRSLELSARSALQIAGFAADGRDRPHSLCVISASFVTADARLAALRDLLVSESRRPSPDPELCDHLLAAFLRCAEQPAERRSSGDAQVARALSIMRERIAESLRISELARAVGLSRAAFARRFRAAIGEPPERHWARLRMQRAAELLASSDDGLAAIAASVGFVSEFAFSRAFKRWHGVPPGEYRRELGRGALRPRLAA